ncbi:tRNA(1)(Val) (adenine(37)-N(6))-methyltransferase TrmN [Moellerella wisconsensis]|uniref:tRNA(1)(Val) (adenine(37)-N(6))-methyltransferase TrmN n=1 Tax=Moellerella wisconsensis TaxID=158849 RepID=UPI000640FDEE|nr:tRNA1(Val) (adenine(37)-N6)-methyltransferase [Moellerella wisconsensis]KLN95820.1 tRNA (adenine-N6)-methyltransferase [Moellerella wisconsensis]WJW83368.1 tRNA1(Val) (adenine(37)-N6)-methyltransferase [Moellerella wisconsensis]
MGQTVKRYRKGGFTFKQFFVGHDRCAMKVGTDGVLLGAWAPVENACKALDIGCGSGLISLMLAQRQPRLHIDAIELDPVAAEQAAENFQASPWADRLQVYAENVLDFVQQTQNKYALIVSNPPYFEPAVSCRDSYRDQARYTGTLNHQSLLMCAKKLLTADGLFCVVLPSDVAENVEQLALQQGWSVFQRTNISDKSTTPIHRVLLAFSQQPTETLIDSLVLKQDDGKTYTPQFIQWITDFYVNY